MFVQDWTPVVFKKKEEKKGPKGQGRVLGPTHLQKLDENSENYKDHKKIQKILADSIKQKRIELKLTQEQLAQKVNVRANVIHDIEIQKGIYDSVIMERIKKVLGITKKNMVTK